MSLNYLPGRPNDTQQSTCQSYWKEHTLFAYCSGNNLIVLSNHFTRLQTIYLERDCVAVDINPSNGFIAVALGNEVHVFKPIHQIMKNPKWAFCCKIFHDTSNVNCLKWGLNNEIVIGSDYLSFWKVKDNFGEYEPTLLWNKRQPAAVYFVTLSQDSQLIASYGKYDHTVKLWKRISIGGEQDIFNLSLLSHPSYVTMIRWKNSPQGNSSQILYTLCSDKVLRVWACFEMESPQITVQHWGSLKLSHEQKYCIIMDSWLVKRSLPANNKKFNYFFENEPDIVMLGSPDSTYSIYTLENLSTDPPKPLKIRELFTRRLSHPILTKYPTILYFSEIQPYDKEEGTVSFIAHIIEGILRHSTFNMSHLLDSSITDSDTMCMFQHKFTGHNKSIQKLVRSSDGEAMLTISRFSENCIWKPQYLSNGSVSLTLKNIITTDVPIKMAVVHERGNLMICLLENYQLQAWECPIESKNSLCASVELEAAIDIGEPPSGVTPLLMLNTPENEHNHDRHFVAVLYNNGNIRSFEVSKEKGIFEVQSDAFNIQDDDIFKISSIDPVHATFFSDRPLIAVTTKKGVVRTYKAIVKYNEKKIEWITVSTLNTGIENPMFVRGSSTGKLCTVDTTGKGMKLWDLNRGVMEYEESFDEIVEDIDWTSTEQGQSIVSIGFASYVLLYTQLRYDYTNSSPSYLPFEKIDITSHTAHNIGDSIWMKDGTFVVASGNQLYIKDKSLDLNDPFTHRSIGSRKILSNDILHLNSVLNGPLPVYHPQFLIQSLYANKVQLVKELLLRLFLEIRKINLESRNILTDLPSDLEMDAYKFLIDKDKDYPVMEFPDPYPKFDKKVANGLSEQLTKVTLPYLTRHQQITLITVIEAMEDIVKYELVVDVNGIRFLLGVKLFLSHKKLQKQLLMRDVSWALHSDNKELLLSLFDSHINSWETGREYKISYWVKEDALVDKFEQIAKYEFSKNDKKDPSRCAIFYLALKKKQILLSLWKVSTGHPEQQKMLKFLKNDFSAQRWRTAALKNAFALMSKHRYMDAASFFLLGGSLKDSVNVLCKQVEDMDLAIGVCRVYEGDDGPVLGDLLKTQLLPNAIMDNDKWTTSFIYWKLRKQDISIKALVTASIDLDNNSELLPREKVVSKSFLVEDPALLFLYQHLRTRNIRYFFGSLELGNKIEYKLIMRVVDILCRMGCNYLAASLVRNWRFIDESKQEKTVNKIFKKIETTNVEKLAVEPTSTTRVRPSLFDMFDGSHAHSSSESGKTDREPNSLLDSYSMTNNLDTTQGAEPANDSKKSTPSLLDQFTDVPSPSSEPTTSSQTETTGKSILDDYMNPSSNSSKNLLGDFSSKAKPVRKAPAEGPRNLLDDFM